MEYAASRASGSGPTIDRSLRRLAAAVLLQAVQDVCSGTPRDYREALAWVTEGNTGAVTFEMCCRYLNRDPDTTRRRLLTRRGLSSARLLNWTASQETNWLAA